MNIDRIELIDRTPTATVLRLRYAHGPSVLIHGPPGASPGALLADTRRQLSRMPETILAGRLPEMPGTISRA